MIEITATMKPYGTDRAEADSPEAAVVAARTLSEDIREATGTSELVRCEFYVDGVRVSERWF